MQWPAKRTVVTITFGGIILTSWLLAALVGTTKTPAIVVVATHKLPAHYKIGPDDLQYAIARLKRHHNTIERPQEVVGVCTLVELKEDQVVDWNVLAPRDTADNACASAEVALRTLATMIETPSSESPRADGTRKNVPEIPSAGLASRLVAALAGDGAIKSALGEFSSEFLKQFAKRLGENAADRAFGRDRTGEKADLKTGLEKPATSATDRESKPH